MSGRSLQLVKVTHDGRRHWDDRRRFAYLRGAASAATTITDPQVKIVKVWRYDEAGFVRQLSMAIDHARPAGADGGEGEP